MGIFTQLYIFNENNNTIGIICRGDARISVIQLNTIKYIATILLITMEGFSHSTPRQPPLFTHNCHLFIFFLRCHINDILGNKNPNTFLFG